MWTVLGCVASLLGLLLAVAFHRRRRIPSKNRHVFVIGADCGFGYSSAWYLHDAGCVVIAGCLQPEGPGAEQLRAAGMRVLHIDVTDGELVESAMKKAETLAGEAGLWAVFYNAGVLIMGRINWLTWPHVEQMIDVNFKGALRVAKACVSALEKTKGRLIMVSSPCSWLHSQELAVYAATKSAINAMATGIRLDLRSKKVDVVVLIPGDMIASTNILSRQKLCMDEMWSNMDEEQRQEEAETFLTFKDRFKKIQSDKPPTVMSTDRLRKAVLRSVLDVTPLGNYYGVELGTLFWLVLAQILPSSVLEFLLGKQLHFLFHRLDATWLDLNNII